MAVYALLLLVFLAIADWGFHHTSGDSTQDAQLVYCLAPGHLAGLVSAAEALDLAGQGSAPSGVIVGGRTLSLAHWRAADAPEFQRSCAAYATANMPSPSAPGTSDSSLQTVADVLLPVIAGALLTMAADDFKQAADRRWAQADELRADWRAFQAAASAFAALCAQPTPAGKPATDDLDEKRRKLLQTVRKIRGQHRRDARIGGLQPPLEDGPLGPTLRGGWDADHPARQARERHLLDSLVTYGAALDDVANSLERRVWLRSKR